MCVVVVSNNGGTCVESVNIDNIGELWPGQRFLSNGPEGRAQAIAPRGWDPGSGWMCVLLIVFPSNSCERGYV